MYFLSPVLFIVLDKEFPRDTEVQEHFLEILYKSYKSIQKFYTFDKIWNLLFIFS